MILIHAHAQRLRNGMPNPKNFPHWPALIAGLDDAVVQVGVLGDEAFVSDMRIGLPLSALRVLVEQCQYWVSVDSFLPHLAHHVFKPGVVLWSVSDPKHFGYPENLNLLRDRSWIRTHQFRIWEEQTYHADAFVPADEALAQIRVWRQTTAPKELSCT